MQIIEKGSWDEVFSINGSGHVHMKLHFTLSEEDRNRVRVMVLFSSCNNVPSSCAGSFLAWCLVWKFYVICIVNRRK